MERRRKKNKKNSEKKDVIAVEKDDATEKDTETCNKIKHFIRSVHLTR